MRAAVLLAVLAFAGAAHAAPAFAEKATEEPKVITTPNTDVTLPDMAQYEAATKDLAQCRETLAELAPLARARALQLFGTPPKQ